MPTFLNKPSEVFLLFQGKRQFRATTVEDSEYDRAIILLVVERDLPRKDLCMLALVSISLSKDHDGPLTSSTVIANAYTSLSVVNNAVEVFVDVASSGGFMISGAVHLQDPAVLIEVKSEGSMINARP